MLITTVLQVNELKQHDASPPLLPLRDASLSFDFFFPHIRGLGCLKLPQALSLSPQRQLGERLKMEWLKNQSRACVLCQGENASTCAHHCAVRVASSEQRLVLLPQPPTAFFKAWVEFYFKDGGKQRGENALKTLNRDYLLFGLTN